MLIAEELLLLLVADRTGRFLVDSTKLDNVLAGAVLVELATIERVGFVQAGRRGKRGRMVVLDPTPPGDPVLDHALAAIAANRPAKPENLIAELRKRLRSTLLERLRTAGALRRSTRKVMGVFPLTLWPAADAGHKRERRAQLQDVLVAGAAPDPHTLRSSACWQPSTPRTRSSTATRRPCGPGRRRSQPETGPAMR
jgi:hypothetical protein